MATLQVRKNRTKQKINYAYPVVLVVRSNKNMMVQVLEPITKKTLFTAHTHNVSKGTKTDKSAQLGTVVAQYLKKFKIDKVVFDRNGYVYHGRIKAVADSIREQNIEI